MKKFFKILKFILIGFLIFLVFGTVLTKCANCKNNPTTTNVRFVSNNYAKSVSTDMQIYSDTHSYNFNYNIATYQFLNFKGKTKPDNYNIILNIIFYELPKQIITFELINQLNEDFTFNFYALTTNGNYKYTETFEQYLTYNFNDDEVTGATFTVSTSNNLIEYDYNFNMYSYIGAYVPGYGQGLAAGLQQGKAEGAEIAKYGIFQNATVDAEFTYGEPDPPTRPDTFKENVSGLIPSYISNGINTYPIWTQYETLERNNSTYTLESANITINLIEPFAYSNNAAILINGPSVSLIDSIILTDINNQKYTAEIVYNPSGPNFSKVDEEIIKTMGLIKSISVYFGRASDTMNNVSIVQDNGNYVGGFTSGYNDGYNDGRFEGESAGYDKGYNKGFNEGESQGYANAVSEGVSQMGLFSAAVSFIKVFFQMTTEFLGTKIVGDITLGLLVVGLPAAFMIVNLAIGLAKKFLGGRGASEGGEE